MQQPGGRVGRRTAVHVAAHLEALDKPSIRETVSIEDISTHGARVLTSRHWRPRERVIVSDLFSSFRAIAEVVYCRSADKGLCVIGVKFDEPMNALPSIDSSSP
ncbi:MAG TPA: PilZ domain-containing protein [Steroidobacteraceae bacterium]|nr:PilZ domain-containing protein [Steroidobacteraceae bacterium]